MSRRSLESAERPIMAPSLSSKRTSNRYSTYSAFSASPAFTSRLSTVTSSSTSTSTLETQGLSEIRHLTAGLDRLENKHLQQQRFVPSAKKTEDLSKLALGAKLERALDRRMVDQDAVFRVKVKRIDQEKGLLNEKVRAGEIKA